MNLYVDYNAEASDGKFIARQSQLEAQVRVGQVVQTEDEDKNRLLMVVDELDGARGIVYLRPDWATWIDGDATTVDGMRIQADGGWLTPNRPIWGRSAATGVSRPLTSVALSGSVVQYA